MLPDHITCLVCMKIVFDSEKGLYCENKWENWFHSTCVIVSDSEYRKLAINGSKNKWFCNRADYIESKQHPFNNIVSSFGTISSQMAIMFSKLDDFCS